jgi:hypothetical protein
MYTCTGNNKDETIAWTQRRPKDHGGADRNLNARGIVDPSGDEPEVARGGERWRETRGIRKWEGMISGG